MQDAIFLAVFLYASGI